MKHPIDISTWGEFKVGELFDMFPGRRLKKADFKDGDIPFVMASSYNNGIVTTLANPISTNENFLTADIFGNVFYQQGFVGYGDDNCGLKLKYREGKPNEYLFLATVISSISVQASFTNKLRGTWYVVQTIPLPLKHGTNPADYSQADIDWDYMEGFMSRVQEAAKERLANLPEPGQKSKTPVDVSKWGEFKVGELFDVKLSDGDNKPKKLPKGDIPLVSAGTTNNGIVGYFESDTIIFPAGSLTADMFGQVFYQPNEFQTVSHGRVNILIPKQELSPKIGHFIVTILNNVCKKYSFTEMLTSKKLQAETIPLPLKPHQGDYTQEDIDWDYMESFMSQFQNLAKNRVVQLSEK